MSGIIPDPKNDLTSEQEAFALRQHIRGTPVREIYNKLSAGEGSFREGLPRYGGTFSAFRNKLNRLVKDAKPAMAAPVETIDPSPVDLSSLDAQMRFLTKFISTDRAAKPGDRIRALQMLRDLQDRIEAKGKDDPRTLLTNPRYVELDLDYFNELMLTCRTEFGGLHKLDLIALNQQELKDLIREAARALASKDDQFDMLTLLDGHKPQLETRFEKLSRLRREIESLSDEEIKALENRSDLEPLEGGDYEDEN